MSPYQATLNKTVKLSGIGLHSGKTVNLTIFSAPQNSGIHIQRIDLPNSTPIKVHIDNLYSTNLCTTIGEQHNNIATIEHLMAAFMGLGIDNAFVCIDGPELPIMDGSAAIFVEHLLEAGIQLQQKKRKQLKINQVIEINNNSQSINFTPANKEHQDYLEIDYSIAFSKSKAIGKQRFSMIFSKESFIKICKARTFCHHDDIKLMHSKNLAKGGSLDNAIVVDNEKVLNTNGLRYKNEFVKHKLLDCRGDLSLISGQLTGKLTVKKGGHELHAAFSRKVTDHINKHLGNKDYASANTHESFLHLKYFKLLTKVAAHL